MKDYRSDALRRLHNDLHRPQELIDLWNAGYDFHETHFPWDGPQTPMREALEFSPYSVIDRSQEAREFWLGFEAATLDGYERGDDLTRERAQSTDDDIKFAMEEVMRYLRGDEK